MDDVGLTAQQRREEKQARKSEVLKLLEVDKNRFLTATQNFGIENDSIDLLGPTLKHFEAVIKASAYSNFRMPLYLHCTKAIYLMFGKRTDTNCYQPPNVGYFIYILNHARLFGDQSRNMIQLMGNKKTFVLSESHNEMASTRLPDSNYMLQITNLINYLNTHHDDTKYFILNANVTYITIQIILAWRYYKDGIPLDGLKAEANNAYLKLCPHAFSSCELPKMTPFFVRRLDELDLDVPASQIIYAFNTVKDDQTKTMLQNACKDLQWYKMTLPRLFFKVVSLYGVEKARLWDLLSSKKTSASLSAMANAFDKDEIFPCCGYIFPLKTISISHTQNTYLCTVLACIVDFKIGLNKSFFRKSDWVDDDAINAGMKIARVFYQFHEKQ